MDPKRLSFLEDLKTRSEAENVPNISRLNAKFIHFLARMKQAKNVLEIGTANGYSTIWLADAVEPFGGHVTSIDLSTPAHNAAVKNVQDAEISNVTLIHANAKDVMQNLYEKKIQNTPPDKGEGGFNLIFIDARKGDYPIFWELAKPLLAEDGLVIIDDVIKFPEKTQAFHEHMATETEYEQVIIPVDGDDGVMLVQQKTGIRS